MLTGNVLEEALNLEVETLEELRLGAEEDVDDLFAVRWAVDLLLEVMNDALELALDVYAGSPNKGSSQISKLSTLLLQLISHVNISPLTGVVE